MRMFLDVRRRPSDTLASSEVVLRFGHSFRERDWPRDRPLPELFYFPSSLVESADARAALHAKCVVVDVENVFVSSANFTEATQQRNVEGEAPVPITLGGNPACTLLRRNAGGRPSAYGV